MIVRLFILSALVSSPLSLLGEGVDFVKEILPILQDRCFECHQAPYEKSGRLYKAKAGLRMDGLAHLMFGSDEGPVLVPNHPSKSSIYTRVALPADDDDRMPPKGDPLTTLQQNLLLRWIGQGADFGTWVGATDGIDLLHRKEQSKLVKVPEFVSYFQKMGEGIKPADAELVGDLRRATDLLIRPIGKESPLLEVRVVTRHSRIKDEIIENLLPLAKWVVKLDLRDTALTDKVCGTLSKFSSMVELNLRGCKVGDKGVGQLMGLKNLQSLNLGNTEVTEAGVSQILKIPTLNHLNIFQTEAVREFAKLGTQRAGVRIVR